MFFIYGLQDPETYRIHYVGLTGDVNGRFNGHLGDRSDSQKTAWLRSLAEKGLEPNVVILEECYRRTEAINAEAWWIAQGIRMKWPLTNHQKNVVEETERKLRAKRRNVSFRQVTQQIDEREALNERLGINFPLRQARSLTKDEKIAVRELAQLERFQFRGQVSKRRLVPYVYGSRDTHRDAWVQEALDEDETEEITP